MHVRVQMQVLSPGVQDGQKADVPTQVFRVGRNLKQRLGGGAEQGAVQPAPVGPGQATERLRQRKDDVEVFHWQQFGRAFLEPPRPLGRLALGAVAISARVVSKMLIDVSSEDITMTAT